MNNDRIAAVDWQLDRGRAVLSLHGLRLSIDLENIQRGLCVETDSHGTWQGGILGVSCSGSSEPLSALVETYARGSELFAEYGPLPERPYRVSTAWQCCPAVEGNAAVLVLRLLVSVRTDVLQSRPTVIVSSEIPGTKIQTLTATEPAAFQTLEMEQSSTPAELEATCLLVDAAGAPHRYLEMIDPRDRGSFAVRQKPDGTLRTQWTLLLERSLEKGVIRRARLQAVILPQDSQDAAAIACWEAFVKSLAPLSA